MNERITLTADAAVRLFLQQGYTKTHISHIAKAAGISVGSIYLDFAGKKEIMHFILKCTMEPGFIDREFEKPITDDLFNGLEDEIVALFKESGKNLQNISKLLQTDTVLRLLYRMLSICFPGMQ